MRGGGVGETRSTDVSDPKAPVDIRRITVEATPRRHAVKDAHKLARLWSDRFPRFESAGTTMLLDCGNDHAGGVKTGCGAQSGQLYRD